EFDKTCHPQKGISPSSSNQTNFINTTFESNYRQTGQSTGVKVKILVGKYIIHINYFNLNYSSLSIVSLI
ncbi:hypothetical protein FRX31_019515, partial [Thalictrum thalictroides]